MTLKQKNIKQAFEHQGIIYQNAQYQLSSVDLREVILEEELGKETSLGALAINTGKFTGRSPKDRFIVKDQLTEDTVWWGDVNIPFDSNQFMDLHRKMTEYLSDKKVYIRDCMACAHPDYKMGIRVINEYPWSNLFANNMFLRPSEAERKQFQQEWTVINAPGFLADPKVDGTRSANFAILDLSRKIALIGGTGYTGEIKKGIFSALNFTLPVKKNVLPMHCSVNVGESGDTAIFFGLSGTGKTTLSTDPNRKLVGDDEHGWDGNNNIFNFEGGCYAKVINLSEKNEPDIFNAIKEGALLENVVLDETGGVDFEDASITQNTRVSYPIYHIKNIQVPSVCTNPKNIFFLTADAFGVLPPISRLTPNQAAYHFISGYTAKVAGTEAGVVEPVPSFSACFGAPFMPLHPSKYADMLSEKIKEANVNVWLVNTGWTGGPYGVGNRIQLKYTRAMIHAAINGDLGSYSYEKYHIHSVFGLAQPRSCPGVPYSLLSPRATWNDDKAYYKMAFKLSNAFRENFKKFEADCNEEIMRGGPQRYAY
ncbi:phosphoenolpyruvate carboxykinase (ATP) [Muricauda ruestringensis]|uniref:Phosphoenolpyruvate carboxykinase (ATP) n=1 Tax=Flagellimonas aurea TaxID=2915619 RepID=A0ABS3GBR6_9FLAO|nr:phosphoenolpyruvate carboxykinase (ATP) [Allomuricauda aurea]MBO0356037.1 phosphoenolpyruvate carboxykinase (ATP) [Allomuricauda aurea]